MVQSIKKSKHYKHCFELFRNFAARKNGKNMKKLSLFLLLVPLTAWAQSESLVSDNKVWTMQYTSINPAYPSVNYQEQMLNGEKEIENITFYQIMCRSLNESEPPSDEWNATGKYIGQDSQGKVYYYTNQFDNYRVIMDFSLQVGDVYQQTSEDGTVVDEFVVTKVSEETIPNTFGTNSRKCIYLEDVNNPNRSDIWIEGVGSVTGGLDGAMIFQFGGSIPQLYKCTEDGNVIYQCSQPTNIGKTVTSTSIDMDKVHYYNLHGQRLTTVPQKGLYIQNGKKVVVK